MEGISSLLSWLKEWAGVLSLLGASLGALVIVIFMPVFSNVKEKIWREFRLIGIKNKVRQYSEKALESYGREFVPGSENFKQDVALQSPQYIQCLSLCAIHPSRNVPADAGLAEFLEIDERIVITGDRGIGKSLIARFATLMILRSKSLPVPLMLHMNELRESVRRGYFSLGQGRRILAQDLITMVRRRGIWIIVDGLDETIEQMDAEEIRTEMQSEFIDVAKFLVCRTTVYDAALKYVLKKIRHFEVCLSSVGRQRLFTLLAEQYLGVQGQERLISMYEFSDRHELLPLDIHVLMQTVKLNPDIDLSNESVLNLYQQFVHQRFEANLLLKNIPLSQGEIHSFHRELAYAAQSVATRIDATPGEVFQTDLSRSLTLSKLLSEPQNRLSIANLLAGFGIVRVKSGPNGVAFCFRHGRFQDLFVAEFIVQGLMHGDVKNVSIWRTIIHQEMGLFIKTAIAEISEKPKGCEQLAQGFMLYMLNELKLVGESPVSSMNHKLATCALGQLVYYAGHVRSLRLNRFIFENILRG